jgi:proteasome lid subunit RPN8/RPN11
MTLMAPNTPAVEQDISAIATGEWPDREFPLGPREKPTRRCVIFRQSVLNDIRTHGRSAPDIEVCGVLVGNVYQDAMGPFVFIEANIRGNFSAGKNAQVTFTAETWTHIQDVMDRQYPDLRILGWYHTHPGHGIFLSDMDLFIHKNFFSLPWHLAFVFDPQHLEEGLFAWRAGNMVVESFVVQKDVAADTMRVARRVPEQPPAPIMAPTVAGDFPPANSLAAPYDPGAPQTQLPATQAEPAVVHIPSGGGAGYPAAAMEMKDLTQRLASLEKRQRWTNAALALLVLVAVAWPIALAALAVMHSGSMPSWLTGESPSAQPAPTPAPMHMTDTTPSPSAEPPASQPVSAAQP